MTEWLIAIAVFLGFLAVLPMLLRRSRSGKSKATAGGVVMAIGLAFMTIFDPARGAAVEEVRKRKDIGDADQGESGEGFE